MRNRADKGWAVKRARPSKKVWCSGLGLCLEMWLVFDFVQGLRCGLSIRHCRCHWVMAAWFVFLHFFLVPLCWYAVSEGQMLISITIIRLFNFEKKNTSCVFLFLRNFKISFLSVFTVYLVCFREKNGEKTLQLTSIDFVYMGLADLRRIARIVMAHCTREA